MATVRSIPEYYRPKKRNDFIDSSACIADVIHAFDVSRPMLAHVIERLIRAGRKPGEPLLKELEKAQVELSRAIEYARMDEESHD